MVAPARAHGRRMVGRRACGPSRWKARAAHRSSTQTSDYRLADARREIILVACSKCDWRAAFSRDDLIVSHGADYAMPNLLNHLAAPSCSRLGSQWDPRRLLDHLVGDQQKITSNRQAQCSGRFQIDG